MSDDFHTPVSIYFVNEPMVLLQEEALRAVTDEDPSPATTRTADRQSGNPATLCHLPTSCSALCRPIENVLNGEN